MEIKIDTLRDSKEDIKRAIAFLEGFLDKSTSSYDSSDFSSATSSDESVFGLFDDDNDVEPKKEEPKKTPRVEIVEW